MKYTITREEINQPLVAPDTYRARIHKVKDRKSEAGNPCIMLTWRIEGTEPPAGQNVFEQMVMIPEAYWKVNEIMNAIGFDGFDDAGFASEDLVGYSCNIVVSQGTDNKGRPRNNVEAHLPI